MKGEFSCFWVLTALVKAISKGEKSFFSPMWKVVGWIGARSSLSLYYWKFLDTFPFGFKIWICVDFHQDPKIPRPIFAFANRIFSQEVKQNLLGFCSNRPLLFCCRKGFTCVVMFFQVDFKWTKRCCNYEARIGCISFSIVFIFLFHSRWFIQSHLNSFNCFT